MSNFRNNPIKKQFSISCSKMKEKYCKTDQ